MQNCYNIVTLVPSSYNKKSCKLTNSTEVNHFLCIFQRKLIDWKLPCSIQVFNKGGESYKLSFHQFEKAFNPEFNLIFYILCSSSVESFKKSIKKLICTCENKDKLRHIVVISVDENDYHELNCTPIDVVSVDINEEDNDNNDILNNLEEIIITKLQAIRDNHADQTHVDSLPIPIPATLQKSPSRFRRLFHIPVKSDHETRKSYKKYEPDNVTETMTLISQKKDEPRCKNDHDDVERKNHHSRISLNSLFKKRSPKNRDSGLSMNSHTSSRSDSKDSDTICQDKSKSVELGFDSASSYSQSSEKPNLSKHRNHTINNKTSNALFAGSCLGSPKIKHKTNIQDAFLGFTSFTNLLVTATSDIIVSESPRKEEDDNLSFCRGQRCISEPPLCSDNVTDHYFTTDIIKYHLWDSGMIKEEELRLYELTFRKYDVREISLWPLIHKDLNVNNKADVNLCIVQQNCAFMSNYQFEENLPAQCNVGSEDGANTSVLSDLDQQYFQLQYVTNHKETPTTNTIYSGITDITNAMKLRTIAEEIQKVYPKEGHRLTTFKIVDDRSMPTNKTPDAPREEYYKIKPEGDAVEKIPGLNVNESPRQAMDSHWSAYSSHGSEVRESDSSASNSYEVSNERSLINNPIVVGGLFAVAALTAPIWSTCIPHCTDMGIMAYSTVTHILNNEMLQHIPNGLISTARQGTVAVTKSVGHFVYKSVNRGNILFR